MEPQFKSSFIPKKDTVINQATPQKSAPKISSGGLIDRIAVILFVLVLIAWGGLFGYQKYVEASIRTLEQNIAEARTRVPDDKIKIFIDFGKQMNIAKELITSHLSVTPLFEALEEHTIPSIEFDEFKFSLNPRGDLMVEAIGKASNFAAVALEEEVLKESELFNGVEVNKVAVLDEEKDRGVSFVASFLVLKQSVLYSELVKDAITPQIENQSEDLTGTEGAEVLGAEVIDDITESADLIDGELEGLFDELDSF